MNILIIAEYYKYGGAKTYLANLLDYYIKNNSKIILAVEKDRVDNDLINLSKKRNIRLCRLPNRPNILFRIFYIFPFSAIYELYLYLFFLNNLPADFTIFSISTPGIFVSILSLSHKSLYVLHTYPVRTFLPFRILLGLLLNYTLSNSKRIVSVSEFAAKQIASYWFIKKNKYISTVYNTSDLVVSKVNHSSKMLRVLTLGTVVWYKNPKQWIEILALVKKNNPDITFEALWAGDGPDLASCKKIIQLNNFYWINFLGHQDDVCELYKKADIYFQPSLMENHSLSVLDSMRYSLPSVVSNVGGLPETVMDGETGFVIDMTNSEAMTEKVSLLLRSKKTREEMGEKAKKLFENKFSYDIWVKNMDLLHQEIGV